MGDGAARDIGRTDGRAPRSAEAIARALADAREYTLSIYAHLTDAECAFPLLEVVNPPRWELGHIGWFQEFWCRRYAPDDPEGTRVPPRLPDADAWWDSRHVPHDVRWTLPLPGWNGVRDYLAATLEDTLASLARAGDDLYAYELALYHEDMHAEALLMTLQTLALPAPPQLARRRFATVADAEQGDIAFDGGRFAFGSSRGDERVRFVFDNEKWAHEVELAPFAIARAPVTNAAFAAFVDDGGYAKPGLWAGDGRSWLARCGRSAPAYWRRDANGEWEVRRFDAWSPLDPRAPVAHVNAFEAEAWCRWAGRRLPGEAEWEFAATCEPEHGPGAVWEWTATPFAPHPGFAADRYAEYSAPWFHTHRVLRGGSWATAARLVNPRFRNFYQPARHDPFVGFRSCALG